MTIVKARLFIDGNNLYHNLKKIGVPPIDINFSKLSELICKFYNVNCDRVIYYNSIPDIQEGQKKYFHHVSFLDQLKNLPKFEVKTRKLQKLSTYEIIEQRKEKLTCLNLCDNCQRLLKDLCINCIGTSRKKEKGIDVLLAVDMVENAINNKCDVCILLSGDADFIPAMDLVKNSGKKAVSAAVYSGYSFNLRNKFPYFVLTKERLLENCLK